MTTKVGNRRLLKLADFLEKLKPKLFNYAYVCVIGDNPPLVALEKGGGCGTSACAIGWMPAVFPRHFKWQGSHVEDRENGEQNFDAAHEYFEISYDEARWLFDPAANNVAYLAKPKTVAKHIRKFVKKNPA